MVEGESGAFDEGAAKVDDADLTEEFGEEDDYEQVVSGDASEDVFFAVDFSGVDLVEKFWKGRGADTT